MGWKAYQACNDIVSDDWLGSATQGDYAELKAFRQTYSHYSDVNGFMRLERELDGLLHEDELYWK